MKLNRLLIYSVAAVIFAAIFTACTPDGGKEFDRALLIGKWESNENQGEFYVYESDGNGHTWDEGDDISESETQAFTWTLEQDILTHIHIIEMGGVSPKTYIVTELTSNTLSYESEIDGELFTFTKVTE